MKIRPLAREEGLFLSLLLVGMSDTVKNEVILITVTKQSTRSDVRAVVLI